MRYATLGAGIRLKSSSSFPHLHKRPVRKLVGDARYDGADWRLLGRLCGEVHVQMNRLGTATLVTAVTVGVAVLAVGRPAMASTSANLPQLSWAYLDSQSPKTKFVNPAEAPPVGTLVDGSKKAHTYRSYFTYDLTQLKGAVVHSSYLNTYEETVTDCSVPATIEVWRTGPVKDNTSWAHPPAELAKLASTNRGAGAYACPSYLGVDMVAELNAALSRHDKSITVEYRITAAQETDPHAGRTFQRPTLSSTANHPPTVTDLHLFGPDRPCGTLSKPSPAAASTWFKSTANDADQGDYSTVLYAIWPVDHPDQRREFQDYYGTDLSQYADGQLLAWQAQASDSYDAGAWSKVCYIVMDKTAPKKPPAVSSKTYPEGNTRGGGSGIKGKFRFDAGGDRDVVAFVWRNLAGYSGEIKAGHPGGHATLEYTPRGWHDALSVASIDATGNRGPAKEYQFWIADTAPGAQIAMNGVGLPSTITLTAPKPETTAFGYQIKGGPETRVPAVGGKATGQLTFTATGETQVVVSNYAKNKLIGQVTVRVSVTDAPGVASAEFDLDTDQIAGVTGSFRFTPHNTDVVAYQYELDGESHTVAAADDDTAVVQWTATAGWHSMSVRSVKADGSTSMDADYQFSIIDTRPAAYANELNNSPGGAGVGVPVTIGMESWLPNLTGFVYRFNGGPEQTVSNQGGPYARAIVTPDHAGDNTVVLQALLSDGTRSPATTYTFSISSGPVLSWTPDGSGTVGKPVTFTFHPGLPSVAAYRYSFAYGDEQTISAGVDGTATATYTPANSGIDNIRVTSVSSDGTQSDTRQLQFSVRDNKVGVYSTYDWSRAGIGWTGYLYLTTQLFGQVVEYHYHVNDGPEQVIPASTEVTSTRISVLFDRNGTNTVYAQSLTSAGDLSPVTEYQFVVGTSPYVVSAQYPNSSWAGGGGVPGTFEFSGGTAGIVSFDYAIDGGAVTTLPVDSDGKASMTYTPAKSFETHGLAVTGRRADGTTTDTNQYYIYVS
jgi:hypothetical protein